MKTQCPHCQAKFKALDGVTGKKVNCPKCSKLFVIEELVETSSVEVCTQCGSVIGRLEHACVFEGNIVCPKCDNILRNIESMQSLQTEPSQTAFHKIIHKKKSNVNIAGMIVSFVLFSLTVVPGMINPFIRPQNSGPAYTSNPDVQIVEKALPFIALGTCLMLFIRSLLPGLGFWRGVLTVIGSYLVFAIGSMVFFLLIRYGPPSTPGAFGTLTGLLLPGLLGGIMVVFGFLRKK